MKAKELSARSRQSRQFFSRNPMGNGSERLVDCESRTRDLRAIHPCEADEVASPINDRDRNERILPQRFINDHAAYLHGYGQGHTCSKLWYLDWWRHAVLPFS
jgi:hypothetical protein